MRAIGHVPFQEAELDDVIAQARATPNGYAAEVLRSDLLSVGSTYCRLAGRTTRCRTAKTRPTKLSAAGPSSGSAWKTIRSVRARCCSYRRWLSTFFTRSRRSSSWGFSGHPRRDRSRVIAPRVALGGKTLIYNPAATPLRERMRAQPMTFRL